MKIPPDKEKIWVFRMVHYQNPPHILMHGMHCRRSPNAHPGYVNIGSMDVISRRDTVAVKSDPDSMVNDYVPFYFGVRTPILYRIKTGFGVQQHPQESIVYLCCRFMELIRSSLQWCFTDGNAANDITAFFSRDEDYTVLDWKSIHADEWSDNNKDSDHDRMRKKQAEFLVKGHVPATFIRHIVVQTEGMHQIVQQWIDGTPLDVTVHSNRPKYYFP